MEDAKELLQETGCSVHDIEMPTPDEILPVHLVLSLAEAASFYSKTSRGEFAGFPTITKKSLILGRSYTAVDIATANKKRTEIVDGISQVFAHFDFIVVPTLPVSVPQRGSASVMVAGAKIDILSALIRYTAPFNQSGHPAITLPIRTKNRLKSASLQIIGRQTLIGSFSTLLSNLSRP